MKKIVTIGFFLLMTNSLFSQKLDYDKDSKWFLGLNAGATWNTTDVKNKTSIGAGFTFGRAFNYNYGKVFSFDLRARYLGGFWRGQDYDTTSLNNYNSTEPSGNVVNIYDTLGYTINNFETQVHELGLELVLHLNVLRERTGWDPYIFGGLNLVWNKTKGDLFFEDTLFFDDYVYDYSPDGITKPDWKDLSDGVYDLVLDGSEEGRYNIDFMPSLGFGLSYQVGPRFAIGLEHKTTFAMKDLFDGYIDATPKWGSINNDIYHYTSAFLKFNFRKQDKFGESSNTPSTDPGNNSVLETANDCDEPTIKMTRPTAENTTVYSPQYKIKALITELAGRQNIVYTVNGNVSTSFLFNRNNEQFESTITLKPGDNIISIKAGNGCGSNDKIIQINYVDCIAPKIVMTSPQSSGMTVDQMNISVTANITNLTTVQFFVNGVESSNFNINQLTGAFSSNVQLKNGTNLLKIIAQNECGIVENDLSVEYKNCIDPFISISNRSGSQIVDKQQFVFTATITEVNSSNNISFRLNGMNQPFAFNVNTHLFQANINLVAGTNTFETFASNECGTASSTITIEYSPCKNPVISILTPNVSPTQNTTVQFSAKLENISNRSQLKFYVNNSLVAAGTYNATSKLFKADVNLIVGTNTLRLLAQNDCGPTSKAVTIVRNTVSVDPVIVEKITICHFPPGNTDNPQQIEIPLSAWPAHQAHGDNLGPCPVVEDPVIVEKITICHFPPGNTDNPQQIEIPLSAWPAHQAHGDNLGPCPVVEDPVIVEKITICHFPPGNTDNPQQIEIPLSAWPAHQAHGDNLGPCPVVEDPVIVEKITICHFPPGNTDNPQQIEIPLSAWSAHQAHGDNLGPCPVVEDPVIVEKITICHFPPGNTDNPQQIEIPLSAWPAHQAHGDNLGPCPVVEDPVADPPLDPRKILICHTDKKTGASTEMYILPKDWNKHKSHGDKKGSCEDKGIKEGEIVNPKPNKPSKPGGLK